MSETRLSSNLVAPKRLPWRLKRLDLQYQGRAWRDEHPGQGPRWWNPPSSRPARRAGSSAAVRPICDTFCGVQQPIGTLMGPSWCMLVSIASAPRLCLPSSANTAGGGVTPGNQVVCLRAVASSRPFKLRLHGSQPLCTSAAASQREPAMLPPSRRSGIHPRHRAASQSADLPPSVASGDCQSSTTFLAENQK